MSDFHSLPSLSIENESIAEQDDDDLTKVANGTSHTQKRERRKTDPKVENIICQSGLNDSAVKLIVAWMMTLICCIVNKTHDPLNYDMWLG